ncbi:hypothetical protein ACHWQZ_G007618 [Mnemiopsis leidyi]
MTTSSAQFSNQTLYGIKSGPVRYLWGGYFFFVLLSSLIGDSIILIASIKYRAFKLHKVIVVIIQHIAVCDLIVSVTYIAPRMISLFADGWILGDSLCYTYAYIKYFFNQAGILLICTMTTTKLFMVKYPLRSRTWSAKRGKLICSIAWILSLMLPIVSSVIIDASDIAFDYKSYTCDFGFTAEIWNWLAPALTAAFSVLPNCLVLATTVKLLIEAKGLAGRQRQSLKWQGIVTTVATSIVYGISVLPYAVYRILVPVMPSAQPGSFFKIHYYRVSLSFLSLNTISNIYIYSLTVSSFRKFLRSKLGLSTRMPPATTDGNYSSL